MLKLNINYTLLDKKTLNLKNSLILTEYKPKIKIINFSKKIDLSYKGKNCFIEIEKTEKGDINRSRNYLNKKRKYMKIMAEEENRIREKIKK